MGKLVDEVRLTPSHPSFMTVLQLTESRDTLAVTVKCPTFEKRVTIIELSSIPNLPMLCSNLHRRRRRRTISLFQRYRLSSVTVNRITEIQATFGKQFHKLNLSDS